MEDLKIGVERLRLYAKHAAGEYERDSGEDHRRS